MSLLDLEVTPLVRQSKGSFHRILQRVLMRVNCSRPC